MMGKFRWPTSIGRIKESPALHFWPLKGRIHGDTFGAMAVGARSLFTRAFTPLLFDVEFVPYPKTHLYDDSTTQNF
jgi:adenosylmethionine-8-amino-7-oxononanoate aminotransferase